MKRLLTILFLCCCISMYGQNGKQKNVQEIKDGIFSMTPEQAEETSNQFNADLDEAGIYGYRASSEEILKVFGKLRKIGYTDTIMKNGEGKYDLRPIQNYIDKRINDIYQWLKDAKNCNKLKNEGITKDTPEDKKRIIKAINNDKYEKQITEVQAEGEELGVRNIRQAENALTDLKNLKTELINACDGNCITN